MRRITAKQVTVQEISIVEKGIKQFSDVEHFKIDVKGKEITVFLPDQEIDTLVDHLSDLSFFKQPRLKEDLKKVLTYSPMMRFVLDDEKNRKFVVERMCFIDPEGWIFLRGPDDLAKLVKKYSPHLGKDTFFELM